MVLHQLGHNCLSTVLNFALSVLGVSPRIANTPSITCRRPEQIATLNERRILFKEELCRRDAIIRKASTVVRFSCKPIE